MIHENDILISVVRDSSFFPSVNRARDLPPLYDPLRPCVRLSIILRELLQAIAILKRQLSHAYIPLWFDWMSENRVNNKDCRNRWRRRFDTETGRKNILIIYNLEMILQLPGFSPVRDLFLVVVLMFSSLN